jgi:hypothetical protein
MNPKYQYPSGTKSLPDQIVYTCFHSLVDPYYQIFAFPQIPLAIWDSNINLALGWQYDLGFSPVDVYTLNREYQKVKKSHINDQHLNFLRTNYSSDFNDIKYTQDLLSRVYRKQRVLAHHQSDHPLPDGVDVTHLINQVIVSAVA